MRRSVGRPGRSRVKRARGGRDVRVCPGSFTRYTAPCGHTDAPSPLLCRVPRADDGFCLVVRVCASSNHESRSCGCGADDCARRNDRGGTTREVTHTLGDERRSCPRLGEESTESAAGAAAVGPQRHNRGSAKTDFRFFWCDTSFFNEKKDEKERGLWLQGRFLLRHDLTARPPVVRSYSKKRPKSCLVSKRRAYSVHEDERR